MELVNELAAAASATETVSMCRICLQDSAESDGASIYDLDSSSDMYLYQKIERCGGIKIIADPSLPTRICRKCNAFLTIAHKFRVICKNSDNYLRDFVCKAPPRPEYDEVDALDTTQGNDKEEPLTDIEYNNYNNAALLWPDDHHIVEEAETTLSPSPGPTKMLDISSDGAAVISLKTEPTLFKEKEKEKQICEICGNIYPRKYALETHMRRHRDERRYSCEICSQSFLFNFQLIRHIRKHTGARPYTCQYCKRDFTDRSALVKHERIHRNERPFSCQTCGKTFTYSNVCKVHQLTHTGEKPYNCGICDKRFTRAHHLRAHLTTLQHASDPRVQSLLKQIKPEAAVR